MRCAVLAMVVTAAAATGCVGPLFEARVVQVIAADCIEVEDGQLVALGAGMVAYPAEGVITGRSWTRVFPWVEGPVVAAVGEEIRGTDGVDTRPDGYTCGDDRAELRVDGFCAVARDC